MHKYSGTHFLSKTKDFNNGNSLRITDKEDISSSLVTLQSRKLSYFGHASLYLPDFNVFVWRLPSGTLANSRVCFR